MNLKKRLMEIKAELKSLRDSISAAKDEELDGIQEKITGLETEKRSIERKIQLLEQAQRSELSIPDDGEGDDGSAEPDATDEGVQPRGMVTIAANGETPAQRAAAENMKKKEQRGKDYKQNRTVILDSTVLIPKKQSGVLTPFPFNQVSSIIDAVNYLSVINGETYDAPYVTGNGEGDYTAQPGSNGSGGKYHAVGMSWNKVTINKTKITAYGEITKELERTPVANYADAVDANITISLRKKLAKEVVIGDGASGHFVGILSNSLDPNAASGASDTVVDYKLGAINENTLDEIVLNYGGDEDIESAMAILLNKLTLLQFAKVRGTDKRKVYNIDYTAGTIDGIKFFTSSNVKSFAAATAGTEGASETIGDAFLAYGDFNKYQVGVFSNIETAKSTDFKFDQGITCFRGDVFMGGNIVGYHAFMRVYKGASSVTELRKITVAKA